MKINKISKIRAIKEINSYLTKNKNRIIDIAFTYQEPKMLAIESGGHVLYENQNQNLIITLKPKKKITRR